jgi:hypothetical protein
LRLLERNDVVVGCPVAAESAVRVATVFDAGGVGIVVVCFGTAEADVFVVDE